MLAEAYKILHDLHSRPTTSLISCQSGFTPSIPVTLISFLFLNHASGPLHLFFPLLAIPLLPHICMAHFLIPLTSLFPSLPLLCLKFHLFAPSPASAPSLFTFCLLDTFHPLKKCNSRNQYDRAEILLRKLKSPAKSLTWLNKKTYYITFIQKQASGKARVLLVKEF